MAGLLNPGVSGLLGGQETFEVRFDDGKVIKKTVPAGASDAKIRSLFDADMREFGIDVGAQAIMRGPPPTEGAPFVPSGTIEPYYPNVSERIGQAFASGLERLGWDGRSAARQGNKTASFLHDLTPVGMLDGIFYPESELDWQLSMLPIPGAGRRSANAIADGIEESVERAGRSFARPKNDMRPTDPEQLPIGHEPWFANHSWESAPGPTTDHLKGFEDLPYRKRQDYHERAKTAFLTEDGLSHIASSSGQRVKRSFDSVGDYEGQVNPGTQDRVGVAIGGDGKVTPRSARTMDEIGAVHGAVGGQDAFGWSHMAPVPSPEAATAILFDLGRPMSKADLRRYGPRIEEAFGNSAGMLPDENGFRIAQYRDREDSPAVAEFVEQLRKSDPTLGAAPSVPGVHSGNLYKNDWRGSGRFGADYGRLLLQGDSAEIGRRFDRVAPQIAENLLKLDVETAAKYGLKSSEEIDLLRRTIVEKGWDGFMQLIRDGRVAPAMIPLALGWADLRPSAAEAHSGS